MSVRKMIIRSDDGTAAPGSHARDHAKSNKSRVCPASFGLVAPLHSAPIPR